jgi:hypothetical protein
MKNLFVSPANPGWVVLRMTPRRVRAMGKDMEIREVALPG